MKQIYKWFCLGLLLSGVAPLFGQNAISMQESEARKPAVETLKKGIGEEQAIRMELALDRIDLMRSRKLGEGGCQPYMGRANYQKLMGRNEKVTEGEKASLGENVN